MERTECRYRRRAQGNEPSLDTCVPASYAKGRMEVYLTPDQEAFIRRAIQTGRFHRQEEAVQEAMSLWEERERRLKILLAVDQAEASLARAGGRRITTHEEVTQLAADIKRRGMERLADEQTPR